MAKTVTIVNGVGSVDLINATYSASAEVNGYDNATLSPASINVVEGTNTYTFTIEASGTLTLHVSEEGTAGGTPIVGATFVRTDSEGNVYGNPITTDSNGNATFNDVPYALSNAPTIYYKQTASDGNHEFDATVQNTTMTSQTQTLEIQNSVGAQRTINLYDANYANLKIDSATITLTN